MDFEQMRVVWDQQEQRPLYAIDEAGLRAQLERSVRRFDRGIFWRDVREIGLGLVVGLCMAPCGLLLLLAASPLEFAGKVIEEPIVPGLCLLVAGGLWFYYSAYQYVGRRRQRQREAALPETLLGDLDRSLAQVDYQIRLSRTVLWWGLLPVYAGSALGLYAFVQVVPVKLLALVPGGPSLLPAIAVAVLLVALVLDLRCKRAPIQDEYLPRRRDLLALRDKLAETEAAPAA